MCSNALAEQGKALLHPISLDYWAKKELCSLHARSSDTGSDQIDNQPLFCRCRCHKFLMIFIRLHSTHNGLETFLTMELCKTSDLASS